MRPDLVLDDDDKRRRFKQYKNCGQKKSENCEATSKHYKSNSKKPTSVIVKTDGSFAALSETRDTDEEDTESLLEFALDTAAVGAGDLERIHAELADYESALDPETGLVLGPAPATTATPLHTAGRAVNEGS